MNLNHGEMLDVVLGYLFPATNREDRVCENLKKEFLVAEKVFNLLRQEGANPQRLAELQRQFYASLKTDWLAPCVKIYLRRGGK